MVRLDKFINLGAASLVGASAWILIAARTMKPNV